MRLRIHSVPVGVRAFCARAPVHPPDALRACAARRATPPPGSAGSPLGEGANSSPPSSIAASASVRGSPRRFAGVLEAQSGRGGMQMARAAAFRHGPFPARTEHGAGVPWRTPRENAG